VSNKKADRKLRCDECQRKVSPLKQVGDRWLCTICRELSK